MRMRDYIKEAQGAVLEYEDGKTGMTTAQLLAPWSVENLIALQLEGDQLLFVGKLYNVVRRLEAAAHKFENHPKSIYEHIVNFFSTILRGGRDSVGQEAIAHIKTFASQVSLLIPAINAMEKVIEATEVHDLRLDGLVVARRFEKDYLALLERAELSSECLLERLTWAKRVLTESLPAWGY